MKKGSDARGPFTLPLVCLCLVGSKIANKDKPSLPHQMLEAAVAVKPSRRQGWHRRLMQRRWSTTSWQKLRFHHNRSATWCSILILCAVNCRGVLSSNASSGKGSPCWSLLSMSTYPSAVNGIISIQESCDLLSMFSFFFFFFSYFYILRALGTVPRTVEKKHGKKSLAFFCFLAHFICLHCATARRTDTWM